MRRTGTTPRVLIVGAGLAGSATAIRLLRFAREPLEVVLLERRPDYRSAGVAYHRDGNPWEHVFNIQAGRMSVFREDVLDFVDWANSQADRGDWPEPWAGFEFVEQGPAPRRIFHDYLIDRLAEAEREARPGVVLKEVDGEAVDLQVRQDGVEVTVRHPVEGGTGTGAEEGPGTEVVSADYVVLATGLELRDPPFAAAVASHPAFVRDPHSAGAVRKLRALPAQATVAIVGSVLSAYDSTGLLLRQGHTGTIYLISGSGTIFRTYPGGHEHAVVRLPCPETLLEPYRNREEFLARLLREWQRACSAVLREHPDTDPTVVAERVTKAWEPYVPEIVRRIPSDDLRGLLDGYSTVIAAYRVAAVEYTMSIIERSMRSADGAVKQVIGRVRAITPTESGRLVVSVGAPGEEREVEADLVVSNFGREWDYSRVGHPFWQNLVRRGTAVPHRRTGRGVEVDERGALLGADGKPAGPLFAVGVLREGDEIVRNGRTGAFAFNLAAIKNQSVEVAARVVELLELFDHDPDGGAEIGPGSVRTMEEATQDAFDDAVSLEVKRMAARARGERDRIDALLDARIRAMRPAQSPPVDLSRQERLMRVLVNRAAVRRLTDVSVPPRQLRRELGIAQNTL